MATRTISVRERIQRVTRAMIATVAGIGTVYRWDMRGLRDPETGLGVNASGERLTLQPGDAQAMAGDEAAENGAMGSIGTTVKKLPQEIHVKVAQVETETRTTEELANDWLYLLEQALMGNRRMDEALVPDGEETEGAGPNGIGNKEILATDTMVTDLGFYDVGQREIAVVLRIETTYETLSGDPARGPGITALTETTA